MWFPSASWCTMYMLGNNSGALILLDHGVSMETMSHLIFISFTIAKSEKLTKEGQGQEPHLPWCQHTDYLACIATYSCYTLTACCSWYLTSLEKMTEFWNKWPKVTIVPSFQRQPYQMLAYIKRTVGCFLYKKCLWREAKACSWETDIFHFEKSL